LRIVAEWQILSTRKVGPLTEPHSHGVTSVFFTIDCGTWRKIKESFEHQTVPVQYKALKATVFLGRLHRSFANLIFQYAICVNDKAMTRLQVLYINPLPTAEFVIK
jgi:hypothetical protein